VSAHTFAQRVLDRDRRAHEFDVLARLLSCVPVRRLVRPPDLSLLAHVRDTILEDVAVGIR
jgi:hypothetical protein